jgi:ABC-type transport system involved in cytochrome c biogenesis permease subunit
MTTFKQLLITGTLLLGMHHGVHAYDAYTLNAETAQILTFAQILRQSNHTQGPSAARWLEEQVCDPSCNVNDNDILVMATIVNNPHLTIPSKISALSQIIAAKRAEDKKIALKTTLDAIVTIIPIIAFFGFTAGIIALAAMEERANPTQKIRIIHQYPGFCPHWHQSS